MTALDAILWLERAGYRLEPDGGGIRFRRVFAWPDGPAEEEIRRALGALRARKAEALALLRALEEFGDPRDWRFDSSAERWVKEPGWWKQISSLPSGPPRRR